MRVRLLLHCLIIVALLSLAAPVNAGGMATVHLDAPPEDVTVGVPWAFGMMVLQHDVTPVNVDQVTIAAQHRVSGETLELEARQEGVTGHYVAELTFLRSGSWKWSITPAPFAGTSFESIDVLDEAGAGSDTAAGGHPVNISAGTCDSAGVVAYPLSDVGPGGLTKDGAPVASTGVVGSSNGEVVSISATTVDVTIGELLASPHAITIHESTAETSAHVGCGNISGQMWDGELVVGLQQVNDSGNVGIAVLGEADERTTVTLYMMTVAAASDMPSGPMANVEITAGNSWMFAPARLEISAGTTVIWTNKTDTSHTVTGDDLAFEDSGPFGLGETYSQTFAEPGTYSYFCSPHPFMTGTIVVT